MRLIDADALKDELIRESEADTSKSIQTSFAKSVCLLLCKALELQQTVDAVPTEFVMENFNLEFVCDALTDEGEWCSERCQYSEPQPECIHRYIDRIWRKEHDKTD